MLKSEKRNWDRCRQNRQTLCLTDCLHRRAAMPFGLDLGRAALFLLKFEFEQDFRSFMKFVQPLVLTICKLSHIDLAILFS